MLLAFGAGPCLSEDRGFPDDGDWKLVRDSRNIQLYKAPVPGSRYQAFRAETVLDAELDTVFKVLMNPDLALRWIHLAEEVRVLERLGPTELVIYQTNKLPFPLVSREAIFHLRANAAERDQASLQLLALPGHSAVPGKRRGYARITRSRGLYQLFRERDGVRLIWSQHTEPGGRLPALWVNAMLVDMPYKTLLNLTELLKSDPARDADEEGAATEHQTVLPP